MGASAKRIDRVRVVICDTGPILHLREAGALKLLEKAGEVIVPLAVERELETRMTNWSVERPAWLRIERAPDTASRQVEEWREVGGLGAGEAEAIVLARSLSAEWVLTDDAGARVVASLLGLEVHGSLGVILWAAANGHLQREEAFSMLERLAKSSLWISSRILNEARDALEQLFQTR
jgi:predicted nucleic acid-binding protein